MTTPAIAEGYFAPAFANVTMSADLIPFVNVTLFTNATDNKNYINYTFTANTEADFLFGR